MTLLHGYTVYHSVQKINTISIPITPILETQWVNLYLWDTLHIKEEDYEVGQAQLSKGVAEELTR